MLNEEENEMDRFSNGEGGRVLPDPWHGVEPDPWHGELRG